jgi:hypothetical protein
MDPLVKKLQYKGQSPALIRGAPAELASLAAALEAEVHTEARGQYEFVLLFTRSEAELEKALGPVSGCVKGDGVFWICYPKGTSRRYSSDLNRDRIVAMVRRVGFEGVSMVALDADWSALRVRAARYLKSNAGKK